MITEFLKGFNFTIDETNLLNLKGEYYLVNESIRDIISKNSEKPKSAGMFLGKDSNKRFTPSLQLIKMISKKSKDKMIVNDKTGWLFACGRDIMKEGVVSCQKEKGLILIQDGKGENLGIARIENQPDIFAMNVLDIGDYIRREK